MSFLVQWTERARNTYQEHDITEDCKVAFCTSITNYLYLRSENLGVDLSEETINGFRIEFFSDIDKARSFLNQGKTSKMAI